MFSKSANYNSPFSLSITNNTVTPTIFSKSPRPLIAPIVTSGLVLYLDAALSASYPGSGTVWYDLSDNGNDVTMQNAGNITYSSSGGGYFTLGSAAYFNKTSTANLPTGSSPYTLSAWIQLGSSWGLNGVILIGTGFGTENAVNAFRMNGTNVLENYWWGNDYGVGISLSPTTQWFNCVAQWDGTNRSLWLNGVQVGTESTTGLNVTNSLLQIGATWSANNEYLQGKIGQALIYNRALTSEEILQNYTVIKDRYNPSIISIGLQLYLNAATYSGSGAWIDSIASRSFTLYGTPTYSSTIGGGSFLFTSSSSQYAECVSSLASLSTWTVEVWHYYTGTNAGGYPTIVTEYYPGGTQLNYTLGTTTTSVNNADMRAAYYNGSSWQETTGYTLTANNWYHIVGTCDSSQNITLYVNAVSQASGTGTGTPTTSTGGIRLMRRWDLENYWGGRLGVVRIYDIALTSTQITQNYLAEKSRFMSIVASGLVLYLDTNNVTSYPGSGTVWYDLSGNGNNATLQTSDNIIASGSGYNVLTTGPSGIVVNTAVNLPQSYTKSLWIYFTSAPTTNGNLMSSGNGGTGLHYFWGNGSSQFFSAGHDAGSGVVGYITDTVAYTTGVWINYVLTYDNSSTTMKMYHNGVLSATTTNGGMNWSGGNMVSIGDFEGSYNINNAYIDVVLVYNRAITSEEVMQNYSVVKGRYGV
jgi:hypothetical protein